MDLFSFLPVSGFFFSFLQKSIAAVAWQGGIYQTWKSLEKFNEKSVPETASKPPPLQHSRLVLPRDPRPPVSHPLTLRTVLCHPNPRSLHHLQTLKRTWRRNRDVPYISHKQKLYLAPPIPESTNHASSRLRQSTLNLGTDATTTKNCGEATGHAAPSQTSAFWLSPFVPNPCPLVQGAHEPS